MTRSPARTTELGLLVLGAVVIVGAYVLAALGKSATIPAHIIPFLGIILGLLAVAHLAVRRLAPNGDSVLLPVAGLLNGIGYVFISRLNPRLSGLQAVWTFLGIGAFIGTLVVVRRVRDLERYRYTFMLMGIALLLMPLLPVVGRNINGNRLWVRVGAFTFQPGELAKVTLAIFFAAYLVERRELLSTGTRRLAGIAIPDPKYFGPVLLAWGISLLIMTAERDLGSSLLFFAFFLAMLWIATARGVYLAIGGALFAVGALFSYETFGHVRTRVQNLVDPWTHYSSTGYQLAQGIFALGAGGMTGRGLGLGSPQQIPAVATDFIFAAIGEELGLLGTGAIVVAFLLLIGVGLRIAVRTEQPFEKLLAAGLTTILGVQTFVILGGVTRLVPLTGITLPFVSYGGSSLIANYILLALLLRISDDSAGRTARNARNAAAAGGAAALATVA